MSCCLCKHSISDIILVHKYFGQESIIRLVDIVTNSVNT